MVKSLFVDFPYSQVLKMHHDNSLFHTIMKFLDINLILENPDMSYFLNQSYVSDHHLENII